MDAFELLRKQAADKMDKAIKVAQDEYKTQVARINELRASLGFGDPTCLRTRPRIGDMLAKHYPSDRPFTIDDILPTVVAAYPKMRFLRASVRNAMQHHKEAGIIRRVAKDAGGYTIWAVSELAVTEKPFGTMSFADVIAEVLVGSKGMRQAELGVAMKELGFRPDDEPAAFVRQISKALYANTRRFKRSDDGKWSLVVR
jgi:hypothetical protein